MNLGAMWEGLKFSGLAMSMVFLVLAILGGLIELIRLLLHRPADAVPSVVQGGADGAQEAAGRPAAAAVPSAELRAPPSVQGDSKLALVAAIAAAFHRAQESRCRRSRKDGRASPRREAPGNCGRCGPAAAGSA